MDTVTSGTVTVDGRDVSSANEAQLVEYRRADVGFVFQFYNLVPNLTALENVELAAQICPDSLDAEQTLCQVGLGERLANFPAQLSGGEQRRLSLLRAIAVEPDYLIMDEVTSGLDLISADAVLTLVENFVKLSDSSCIFITHSRKDAMRIANRIIIMQEGRIAEQGYLIDQLSNQKGQG